MAKSGKERSNELRRRRKQLGEKEITVWVRNEKDAKTIRQIARELYAGAKVAKAFPRHAGQPQIVGALEKCSARKPSTGGRSGGFELDAFQNRNV